MKKLILIAVIMLSMKATTAQTIMNNNLDINNIKARIYSDGGLFYNGTSTNNLGYEVPQGSTKSTMGAGGIWIGGYDANGLLKGAVQTYGQGKDFWSGPLDSNGTTNPTTINTFNRVWKLNKSDIDLYKNWIALGQIGPNPIDSSATEAIISWPAFNPDGSRLAPFVDFNNDSMYNPATGDYPLIKGDQAIFFVFNDNGGTHTESNLPSIGIEIRGMAYAYKNISDSALYNTIFTNYILLNKSQSLLDSVFVGNWSDIDIGWYNDDFIGCDVTRGAYYGYNATAIDGTGQQTAYGANPPAQAVVFLKGPKAPANGIDDALITTPNGMNYGDGIIDNEHLGMGKFCGAGQGFGYPGPNSYYELLNGMWSTGVPITYGGTGFNGSIVADYVFPGTSDQVHFYGTNGVAVPPWFDYGTGSDVRGLGSYGPFKLMPGAADTIDFAYVYGRATPGSSLSSVDVMNEHIDSVISKFRRGALASGVGINEYERKNIFNAYPNPFSETVYFKTDSEALYQLKILDITGKIVETILFTGKEYMYQNNQLARGIYFYEISSHDKSIARGKLIKQ